MAISVITCLVENFLCVVMCSSLFDEFSFPKIHTPSTSTYDFLEYSLSPYNLHKLHNLSSQTHSAPHIPTPYTSAYSSQPIVISPTAHHGSSPIFLSPSQQQAHTARYSPHQALNSLFSSPLHFAGRPHHPLLLKIPHDPTLLIP